jgi:hypothetical protein
MKWHTACDQNQYRMDQPPQKRHAHSKSPIHAWDDGWVDKISREHGHHEVLKSIEEI